MLYMILYAHVRILMSLTLYWSELRGKALFAAHYLPTFTATCSKSLAKSKLYSKVGLLVQQTGLSPLPCMLRF